MPPPPCALFAVRFDVRRGNELLYYHPGPAPADAHLEWKALPSGSHALASDVVCFELPPDSQAARRRRAGVGCFRRRRIADDEAEASVAGVHQRGARLLTVGAIVDLPEATASAWRTATLPVLPVLRHLVTKLIETPRSVEDELRSAFEALGQGDGGGGGGGGESSSSTRPPAPLEPILHVPRGLRHLALYRQDPTEDPLWQLPAVADALGPLLPTLLKRVSVRGHRLLLFCSMGCATQAAAAVALCLAALVEQATERLVGPPQDSVDDHGPSAQPSPPVQLVDVGDDEGGQADGAPPPPLGATERDGRAQARWEPPRIRGLVGLHDIERLEQEAKSRTVSSPPDSTVSAPSASWIAWTTDRILTEKTATYDSLLDLTPLLAGDATSARAEGGRAKGAGGASGGIRDPVDEQGEPVPWSLARSGGSSELPLLSSVRRDTAARRGGGGRGGGGGGGGTLQRQAGTAREFAVFRKLDEAAVRESSSSSSASARGRRVTTSTASVGKKPTKTTSSPRRHVPGSYDATRLRAATRVKRQYGGVEANVVVTALAFLRYWLAGWWLLPRALRASLQRGGFGNHHHHLYRYRRRGGGGGRLAAHGRGTGVRLLDQGEGYVDGDDGEQTGSDDDDEYREGQDGSDEDEDEEEEEEELDPIITASGAGGALRRRRDSRLSQRSQHSRRSSAAAAAPAENTQRTDEPGGARGEEAGSTGRRTAAQARSGGLADAEGRERVGATDEDGAEETATAAAAAWRGAPGSHARLVDATCHVWSEWLAARVEAVEAALDEAVRGSDDDDGGGGGATATSRRRTLTLAPRRLAEAGLSASNAVDAELVRDVARRRCVTRPPTWQVEFGAPRWSDYVRGTW